MNHGMWELLRTRNMTSPSAMKYSLCRLTGGALPVVEGAMCEMRLLWVDSGNVQIRPPQQNAFIRYW